MSDAIGTSLYIDYSDFATGIAEANRLIKLNEQKFKTASAGMDDWSKTSSGLEMRIKSLNTTIELQKGKVSALEKEYEKVKKEKGENSKVAQNLALKLEKEKTALAKSEKEASNYTKKLDDLKKGTDENAKSSQKSEKAVGNLSKAVNKNASESDKGAKSNKGLGSAFSSLLKANLVASAIGSLTRAVGGMVSSFLGASEETKEYRMNMAKVEQTAKTMGVSVDEAKKSMLSMGAISGDLEASGEAVNNLLASGIKGENLDKITQQLQGASIKWKDTLKMEGLADGLQETLATGSATGAFAELLERGGKNLDDFNSKLATCSSEAEKQNLIMSELSSMGLEDIAQGYKEANKNLYEAELAQLEYNDTMAQVGSAFEPINTAFTQLKTATLSSFLPAIKTVASGITELVHGSADGLKKVISGFVNAFNTIRAKVVSIGAKIIQSAVQMLPSILNKLQQAFPLVISLIVDYLQLALIKLNIFLRSAQDYLPSFFSNILTAITDGIGQLIGALPSMLANITDIVFSLLNTVVSTLKDWIPNLIQSVTDGISQLVATLPELLSSIFTNLGEFAENIFDFVTSTIHKIVEIVPELIGKLVDNLPNILNSIVNGLENFLPKIVNGATKMFNGITQALTKILPTLAKNLPKIIDTIITAIKNGIPVVLENSVTLFKNIIVGLIQFIPTLVKSLPQIIWAIVEGIGKLAWEIIKLGGDLLKWLWEGIKSLGSWLGEKASGVIDWVADGLEKAFSKITEVGSNLIEGLWNGIKNAKDWVIEKIKGFGDSVLQGLKDFFGIHSPSKKTAEMGKYLGEGLAVGINDSAEQVNKASKDLANSALDPLKQSEADLQSVIDDKQKQLAEILGLNDVSAVQDDTYNTGADIGEALKDGVKDGAKNTGKEVANGIAKGLSDNANTALNSLNGIIQAMGSVNFQASAEEIGWQIGSIVVDAIGTVLQACYGAIGSLVGNLIKMIYNIIRGSVTSQSDVASTVQTSISSSVKKASSGSSGSGYSVHYNDEQYKSISGAMTGLNDSIASDRQERQGQYIILNQTNNSPKALDSAEIYRQSNKAVNLLAMKVG